MSDRPDLDEAMRIAQEGGLKITGGKYSPPKVQAEFKRKLNQPSPSAPLEIDKRLDNILSDLWHDKTYPTKAKSQIKAEFIRMLEGLKEQHKDYLGVPPAVPLEVIDELIESLK